MNAGRGWNREGNSDRCFRSSDLQNAGKMLDLRRKKETRELVSSVHRIDFETEQQPLITLIGGDGDESISKIKIITGASESLKGVVRDSQTHVDIPESEGETWGGASPVMSE